MVISGTCCHGGEQQMTKSPKDRIKDSFSKDDRESIAKYLDWARSAILDYCQALRRSATILVIVVAIFELIAYSKNQTISVGSFVIARNSIVFLFLPVLVAYFFLQIMADHNRVNQLLSGVVRRLGNCIGNSRRARGIDPDRPFFRPDISPVAADRASVMRCRRSLPVAGGRWCCCHRCRQLSPSRPAANRPGPQPAPRPRMRSGAAA